MRRVPKGAAQSSLAHVLQHALMVWRLVYGTVGWELLEVRGAAGFDRYTRATKI